MNQKLMKAHSFKRPLLVIIAFLSVLMAAFVSQETTTKAATVDLSYGAGYESNIYTHWTNTNGKTIDEGTFMYKKIDGREVFCVDLGGSLDFPTNPGYVSKPITSELYQKLSAIAYYGWYSNTTTTDPNKTMFTQWMIWETLGNKLNSVDDAGYRANYTAFKAMVNPKVAAYNKLPSFAGKTIDLQAGKSTTLTDANGVLNTYNVSATTNTSGATYKVSGNTLTITAGASAIKSGTLSFRKNIAAAYQGSALLYTKAGYQDVASMKLDPLIGEYKVNVNIISETTVDLQKTDVETGAALSGVTFAFTRDGKDAGAYTTDATGKITFKKSFDQMLGKWTYKEVKTVAGYELDSKVYEFVIGNEDIGKTISLKATNKRLPVTIGTTALGEAEHKNDALSKVTINDTVTYKNLVVGKTYTISGVLMDKVTGKAVLVNGKQVIASKTFVATQANGSIVIPFTFDASGLQGHSVVAFESVSSEDKQLTTHADINDGGQTVEFPKVGFHTTAMGEADHKNDALSNVTINDTVAYTNLTVGKTYTVKGVLMDKATGKPVLVNGKQVTAEKTFAATSVNGSVVITFVFDATGLQGHSVVAFESLYRDGTKLGTHADIDDDGQTVEFPKVDLHTTAVGEDKHKNDALSKVTINDTVAYTNLTVGKTYTVKGVLMDKVTGKPVLVNGKQVTSVKTFVAKSVNGSVVVTFVFDATGLQGHSVVAFESLYRDGVKLGTHADINDTNQTVEFPKVEVKTTATRNGKKIVTAAKQMTVTDVVEYKGLTVGKTYTVKGRLIDKKTGKVIATKEITFVAKTANGSVEIKFAFDGSNLGGHDVVAFEDLYRDGVKLGSHADINDQGQTVHINEVPKITLPQTGEKTNLWLSAIGIGILVFAIGAFLFFKRQTK